jgi:hypothetical protein
MTRRPMKHRTWDRGYDRQLSNCDQTVKSLMAYAVWSGALAMKKQYLHLSVYRCDKCQGPVVTGSLAVRENEISKETEKQEVGAICLSCGNRQSKVTVPGLARHFPPTEWQSPNPIDPANLSTAAEKMENRLRRD